MDIQGTDQTSPAAASDSPAPHAPMSRVEAERYLAGAEQESETDSEATAGGEEGRPSPEPEPKPAVADESLERSWSALEKRDRRLVAREREIKERERQLASVAGVAEAMQKKDIAAVVKAMGADPAVFAAQFWDPEKQAEPVKPSGPSPELVELKTQLDEMRQYIDSLNQEKTKAAVHGTIRQAIEKSDGLEVARLMTQKLGQGFLDDIEAAARAEQEQFGETPQIEDLLQRTEQTLTEQ